MGAGACARLCGLADQAFLVMLLASAALLQRLQELLDLLDAESPLSPRGSVRLEIAHVGPPANRSKGHPERTGGLRS